jgi:hypothetical protein
MNWKGDLDKKMEVVSPLLREKAALTRRLREINKQIRGGGALEPHLIMLQAMTRAYGYPYSIDEWGVGFLVHFYYKSTTRRQIEYRVRARMLGSIYVETRGGELVYYVSNPKSVASYDIAVPVPLPPECEDVFDIVRTHEWEFPPKGD